MFNRLTGTRQAIVSEEAGTTRDRQYGKCEWGHTEFSLVDTGGWVVNSDDIFEEEICKQVILATEEADLILFVVDVKNGVTDLDEEVAKILRGTKVPVILCANKTDNNIERYEAAEFYKLGIGDPYCVSAATGSGTGELLDVILETIGKEQEDSEFDDLPKFAVVGRPNAGKSSIINAFLGEDRNIVTDIAGTTRDSILTRYNKFGFDFYIVDTAGIRRKNKVTENLEFYSVMRANKWDLVEDKSKEAIAHYENTIRQRLAPFTDFPIIFTSALTKQRIFKVIETAKDVYLSRKNHVSTSKLNEEMLPLIEAYPPPSIKGKYIKIKYCSQLPNTQIPTFIFYANLPQYVKEPYKRFLENKIRERWNFTGTPIQIFIRQK